MLMILTACGMNGKKIETSIIPNIVTPTRAERVLLKQCVPDFYVRFTEQQRQIIVAKDL